MRRLAAFILLPILFVAAAANALAGVYSVATMPNVQKQDRTKHLVNPDGIIAPGVAAQIDTLLLDARRKASAEVVAVVVDNIETDDIDWFATDLFNTWGIGKKDTNNGILLLVAKDSRRLTIRTGYGAEGVLPDILCGGIINNIIVPRFKEGDYEGGVLAGVKEIHRLVTDPQAVEELLTKEKRKYGEAGGAGTELTSDDVTGMVVGGTVLLGLGGLMFMNSGSRRRNKPRKCPKCKAQMNKLKEGKADYLAEIQLYEELIKSVEYDVWLCPMCAAVEVGKYVGKRADRFRKCPNCQANTCEKVGSKVITRATTRQTGLEETTYRCARCGHTKKLKHILPIIAATSVGSFIGGGGRSGGSVLGGGFGGGRTGGGGASGRW